MTQLLEIAVSLIDKDEDIRLPCRWNEFGVVAMRDIYLNGLPAKLLTLTRFPNVYRHPQFPVAQPNAKGYYNITYI